MLPSVSPLHYKIGQVLIKVFNLAKILIIKGNNIYCKMVSSHVGEQAILLAG